MERTLHHARLELARLYAYENKLNRIVVPTPERLARHRHRGQDLLRRAAGARSSSASTRPRCARHGIRLLKMGMLFPMEPRIVREFARGLEEILVVEEKRSFLEMFAKDILYGSPDRPRIVGKRDEEDRLLVPGRRRARRRRDRPRHRQADRPEAPDRLGRGAHPPPRRAQGAAEVAAARAHRLLLLGLPAQPLHRGAARAAWPRRASAATAWPWAWTAASSASRTWAARARSGSASRPSPRRRTSSRTSATARSSTRAGSRSATRSPPASTSPTRSSTTPPSR